MDMFESVEVFMENVKKKGGLDHLARERDKFLNSI
jgi:hypothetical protein